MTDDEFRARRIAHKTVSDPGTEQDAGARAQSARLVGRERNIHLKTLHPGQDRTETRLQDLYAQDFLRAGFRVARLQSQQPRVHTATCAAPTGVTMSGERPAELLDGPVDGPEL